MAEGAVYCSEIFSLADPKSGFSKIQQDLSLVRTLSLNAQMTLELIQSIHSYDTKLNHKPLPLSQMALLKENLKALKTKFEKLDDYKKTSDPDGGIPAVILADSKLALFLLQQITENSALKAASRQILHSILSLAAFHFPDDYPNTAFYIAIRQSYDQSSSPKRDRIFEVSDPVIFYDGVFAADLKNVGGEKADQVQMNLTFLNRLVSRKALSSQIARSIFEKEILNINPLPLNKAERIALIKSLNIEDRQVNVNSILELAGFKLVETDFVQATSQEHPYPVHRTEFILKFENDPSVSLVFFDDSVILPEEVANTRPTTYSLKGLENVEAFLQKAKPNSTLELRAITVHGMP